MSYTEPSVSEFKAYFTRDFPYASVQTDTTKVLDVDIEKAQSKASLKINQSLFDSQAEFSIGFNYLTAHFLTIDLLNANQGIAGQYNWLTSNKGVGSVSAGYTIPEYISKNPLFAMLSKTTYGAQYLELVMDRLIGNFGTVGGATSA